MNKTLKQSLSKLTAETGGDCVGLPFALLCAQCTLYVEGITPHEIMYGQPLAVLPKVGEKHLAEISNKSLLWSLQGLQFSLGEFHHFVHEALHLEPDPDFFIPPAEPGDWAWVGCHQTATLEPNGLDLSLLYLSTLQLSRSQDTQNLDQAGPSRSHSKPMAHKEDKGPPKTKTVKRQLTLLLFLRGQLTLFGSSATNPHRLRR